VDFTLGKTFKLGEQQKPALPRRFLQPVSIIHRSPIASGSGFGCGRSAPITSVVGTPRLIQFSLKYSF